MTDSTPDIAPVDLQLLTVLKQIVADVTNPDSHYMVSASYIDFIDSQRSYTRFYMCPIYVHQDSARNIDFDEQGILLDTFFSPEKEAVAERIRIPYNQIYRISTNATGGMYTDEDIVYQEMSRFKMPPIKRKNDATPD